MGESLRLLLAALCLVASLHLTTSWDLKPSAEKYWYSKRNHHLNEPSLQEVNSYHGHVYNGPIEKPAERAAVISHSPAGCSYQGQRFSHDDSVTTTQPCLNCTCQRGFVSCFLRVCPTLTAPYNDDSCYLLREPGSCCSTMKCMGPSNPDGTVNGQKAAPSSSHHGQHHFMSNSVERKADRHGLRPQYHHGQSSVPMSTARPPYWSSIRPLLDQMSSSRPSSSSSSHHVSSSPQQNAHRPKNGPLRPLPSTFGTSSMGSQRPTTPSTPFRTATSTQRTTMISQSQTLSSSSTASRHRYPSYQTRPQYPSSVSPSVPSARPVSPQRQYPPPPAPLHKSDSDSNNFFRMSAILV